MSIRGSISFKIRYMNTAHSSIHPPKHESTTPTFPSHYNSLVHSIYLSLYEEINVALTSHQQFPFQQLETTTDIHNSSKFKDYQPTPSYRPMIQTTPIPETIEDGVWDDYTSQKTRMSAAF